MTTTSPTRVGVAGWSYPDWEGIVYPKTPRFEGLAYLTRYFDTIEVNSPFYRIPTAKTTRSWTRRVAENPNFRLTLKLFQGFTHDRNASTEDERAFKDALVPLIDAGVLGGLLLQFPWSFKNEPESRSYLSKLFDRFDGYPLVLEVRHASWNDRELYELLEHRGVGFCNIDQPLIGRSIAPTDKATSPIGYVRLHGRNYQDWFRENAGRDARYDYLYSDDELDPWMDKISEVSENASETYVITNNHFRGQAVVNALQIRSRIERRAVKAPASLVEHYPILAPITESEGPVQRPLF
ncbi:MAG: DUF72 domain-containing protein [Acidobacteriota bacterium]|nr:MAG: DUF72 domain-containing protein [Acidobacteriota bacterium]